jgi:hypothetical protein
MKKKNKAASLQKNCIDDWTKELIRPDGFATLRTFKLEALEADSLSNKLICTCISFLSNA